MVYAIRVKLQVYVNKFLLIIDEAKRLGAGGWGWPSTGTRPNERQCITALDEAKTTTGIHYTSYTHT